MVPTSLPSRLRVLAPALSASGADCRDWNYFVYWRVVQDAPVPRRCDEIARPEYEVRGRTRRVLISLVPSWTECVMICLQCLRGCFIRFVVSSSVNPGNTDDTRLACPPIAMEPYSNTDRTKIFANITVKSSNSTIFLNNKNSIKQYSSMYKILQMKNCNVPHCVVTVAR